MKKGICRYFTGLPMVSLQDQRTTCEAGINYRKHIGGPDLGWCSRAPCLTTSMSKEQVPCDKYEEPTQEEIDKFDAEVKEASDRMMRTIPFIEKIKKKYKGQNVKSTDECPECKGVLHFTHAAYNGHVWGKCETEECLNWVE
jgi:hypothetical protein